MSSPETLLSQGWLATLTGLSLALKVLNSFHGLCPRKNLVGTLDPLGSRAQVNFSIKQKRRR